jgi:uncharacterized protein (UPF0333 family)
MKSKKSQVTKEVIFYAVVAIVAFILVYFLINKRFPWQ